MDSKKKMPLMNRAINQLVKEKTNGNVTEFAKMIGMSQQRISRLFSIDPRSGRYPSVSQSIIDACCDAFDITEGTLRWGALEINKEEVNPYEKLFGENENGVANSELNKGELEIGSISTTIGKPFYNVPFVLGYELPFNDNDSHPDYLIDFTPYNKCDFWCMATGESMHPTISNGDVIAVKKLEDFRYLVNNEIYAIVLKSGLRTIKRTWDNGDSYTLIADNKDCPSQEIPKSEILCVYRVLGAMKMF